MKQIMKRRVAAALAALMAVSVCTLFTGCNDPTETTASTPIGVLPGETTTSGTQPGETTSSSTTTGTVPGPGLTGKYTNYMTGEPTDTNLSNQRPLAIVVDNIDNAHKRQTGLDQADILYEALVAPGITRFMAIYGDYEAVDSVCNVRSGRDYHLDWASYHNAVLMCHGGSLTANYDFYQLALERLGSRWGYVDTMFEKHFSDSDLARLLGTIKDYEPNEKRIDLKYDTLYNPEALDMLLKSSTSKFVGSMTGTPKQTLKFVPYGTAKDMTGASSATAINLSFTAKGNALSTRVSYSYDAATGKYLRSQYDNDKEIYVKHIDMESGAQLGFTNVVVLLTDVETVETGIKEDPYMTLVETRNPDGLGYYFHGGKVIQIKWYSDGNTFMLIDPNGNDLTLATGNTYIGWLDSALISGGNQFWS